MRRYRRLGRRLQTRLFWWFGTSIVASALVLFFVARLFGPAAGLMGPDSGALRGLTEERFAVVWSEPAQRAELVRSLARHLEMHVTTTAPDGRILETAGPPCRHTLSEIPIRRDGAALGSVSLCVGGSRRRAHWVFFAALAAAAMTLWAASGAIARRIGRPLANLVGVAERIGEGDLSSRARLGRHQPGEVGVLAEAINDMAVRIEKQMNDQRELLAAVSHEMRTPLSRIRVLAELLRRRSSEDERLDQLEREVEELDSLIGDLLASSRLDFAALSPIPLSAVELAGEALERFGLSAELLRVSGADSSSFFGDATLIARALANLLDNALKHGGGVDSVRVTGSEANVLFEVVDHGPGFPEDVVRSAFRPFRRGHADDRGRSSLGLGLSLVDRIARAHGGRAWAQNDPSGGAIVAVEFPRKRSGSSV